MNGVWSYLSFNDPGSVLVGLFQCENNNMNKKHFCLDFHFGCHELSFLNRSVTNFTSWIYDHDKQPDSIQNHHRSVSVTQSSAFCFIL